MKISFSIFWIFILAGLGECTMGLDYQKPVLNIRNQWQANSNESARIKPISQETLEHWWKSFDDAQLLMDQALAGNLDIKIVLIRAERRGTRAELFPTVNVKAGAQRQNNPMPGLAPGVRYNLFELGFDALWEIDLFGRLRRQQEAYLAYEKAVLAALGATETALTRYLNEAVRQQMLIRSATDLRESVRRLF